VYGTDFLGYKVANGRHAFYGNDKNVNLDRKMDFANTTELKITPIKQLTITANYTYRFHQNRNTNRSTALVYSQYPGVLATYTGKGTAGEDSLTETVNSWAYNAANVFATYEDTFKDDHHLTVMAGGNLEYSYRKDLQTIGYNLLTEDLNDFDLVGLNGDGIKEFMASGGQSEYALLGFFGRINYDYKGRYLFEVSGRYDGTSRFAKGSRWGLFPSASAGWRISEEDWFAPAKKAVSNLKLRFSYGSLGNQNVAAYKFIRKVTTNDFAGFSFGEGSSTASYTSLSAPNAGDLTWETAQQYNLGIDAGFFKDRLSFTAEAYIRDTKDMLTDGVALPGVYGASEPDMNAADLRTKGYELSIGWRDQVELFGKPFGYNVGATLSDYRTVITKYDNKEYTFAKDYYEGMVLGEIWGFEIDGLFATDAEAQAYAQEVDLSYINKRLYGGWLAGDPRYVDLDGDGKISVGANSVKKPGDRKILGNSIASLQYGLTAGFDYMGIDFSIFFQGTGNHYWYPNDESMAFWGPYSRPYCTYLPYDFLDNVWSEENPDAYFPRPRAYSAFTSGAPLANVNSRYLQNLRYLRLKNLSVGYTVPMTKKIGIQKLRVYFSGENLAYWSPFKKHSRYIDPEAAFDRRDSGGSTTRYNNAFYPWQKTFMFGIDITF
jgi:TonB-linked SusC/RagA family outer membrane protein